MASNALQAKRLSMGMTQVQVAEKAGITERGYRRYEGKAAGKGTQEPRLSIAIKIADALGVKDLRELWSG